MDLGNRLRMWGLFASKLVSSLKDAAAIWVNVSINAFNLHGVYLRVEHHETTLLSEGSGGQGAR